MSAKRLRERIARRGRQVGLDVPVSLLEGLEAYYLELARWNRKINLTAFELTDEGSDPAVDWLLIEPVVAARHIPGSASSLLERSLAESATIPTLASEIATALVGCDL